MIFKAGTVCKIGIELVVIYALLKFTGLVQSIVDGGYLLPHPCIKSGTNYQLLWLCLVLQQPVYAPAGRLLSGHVIVQKRMVAGNGGVAAHQIVSHEVYKIYLWQNGIPVNRIFKEFIKATGCKSQQVIATHFSPQHFYQFGKIVAVAAGKCMAGKAFYGRIFPVQVQPINLVFFKKIDRGLRKSVAVLCRCKQAGARLAAAPATNGYHHF